MYLKPFLLFAASASLCSTCLAAHEGSANYEHITATPIEIEQRSKTVLGQSYHFPKGVPALYAWRITIKPGQKSDWHKHAVPLFLKVNSGSLTVDYGSKGKRTFSKGMSYVEALDWCHQGYSTGNQETVVFGLYLAQESPNHVKPIPCDGPE